MVFTILDPAGSQLELVLHVINTQQIVGY